MKLHAWATALAVTLGTAATGMAQTVGIATTPAGSFTNSAGSAIATVAVEVGGLQTRVQPQAGNSQMAVNSGAVEFGIDNYYGVYFAVHAIEDYEGQPKTDKLQVASQLLPMFVGFMVQVDSDIQSVADLRGKTISSGYGSQKVVDRIVSMYLATEGMTYDDVSTIPAQNVVAAADDFRAGRTDAFVFALGAAKVREVAASVGGVRVIDANVSDDARARAEEIVPGTYPVAMEPNPALPELAGLTNVYAADLILFVNETVPEDAVYTMVKSMHDGKEDMDAIFPPMRDMQLDDMAKPFDGLTYHPGAEKFYREMGIWQGE